MNIGRIVFLSLLQMSIGTGALLSAPSLSALFSDHMVIQRDRAVRIWGSARPGEPILVSFRDDAMRTTASRDGKWRVDLPPQKTGVPGVLIVKGEAELRINDVAVGDVWICSGQSNMALLVEQAGNARQEIARAGDAGLRHFKVGAGSPDIKGEWVQASPQTVGKFSATAYFFAREIRRETGIPIGLVNASTGGTPVESWLSPESLDPFPAAADFMRELFEKKRANRQPSVQYKRLIAPIIPFTARGFLWYQGEANARETSREYARVFRAMITDWREKFGQGDLPFYFVQLPNYKPKANAEDWSMIRIAQSEALSLPNTGMAVTIDIGMATNIHPTNKQEVGRRLSLIALNKTYGKQINCSGPQPVSARGEQDALVVRFDQPIELKSNDGDSFEVAGADWKFSKVNAQGADNRLILDTKKIPAPKYLRYAWAGDPRVILFGKDGLPAAPFLIAVEASPGRNNLPEIQQRQEAHQTPAIPAPLDASSSSAMIEPIPANIGPNLALEKTYAGKKQQGMPCMHSHFEAN